MSRVTDVLDFEHFGAPDARRRAGPRQSDRRAHRLQRRLRAADRHAAADARRARRAAGPHRPRCAARNSGIARRVEFTLGEESARARWVDYVAGLTWALRRGGRRRAVSTLRDRRRTCRSAAGLSSSAALEVAVAAAACAERCSRCRLDDVELAHAGAARPKREFVGAPVGIMDQMACSLADDRRRAVPRHAHAASTSACRCRPTLELARDRLGRRARPRQRRLPARAGASATRPRALLGVTQLRDLDAADRPRSTRCRAPLEPPRAACRHRERARARRRATRCVHGDLRAFGALLQRSRTPRCATTSRSPRRRSIRSSRSPQRPRRVRRAADRRRLRRRVVCCCADRRAHQYGTTGCRRYREQQAKTSRGRWCPSTGTVRDLRPRGVKEPWTLNTQLAAQSTGSGRPHLLSHLRWNFVFQRPQHLLTRCARERRVFFFEEPVFDVAAPAADTSPRSAMCRVAVPASARRSQPTRSRVARSCAIWSMA